MFNSPSWKVVSHLGSNPLETGLTLQGFISGLITSVTNNLLTWPTQVPAPPSTACFFCGQYYLGFWTWEKAIGGCWCSIFRFMPKTPKTQGGGGGGVGNGVYEWDLQVFCFQGIRFKKPVFSPGEPGLERPQSTVPICCFRVDRKTRALSTLGG